jgi:hypothetical protein
MNSALTLILVSTLGFAAPPSSVSSERDVREACSNHSQAGLRDCLTEKVKQSRSELIHAEELAAKTLSGWDEDSRYIRIAQGNLAESNSAFARYREAQCEFSASLSGGAAGNAREIRRMACVASLNGSRADDLRRTSSETPQD